MKRMFGLFEVAFDILYMAAAAVILLLLCRGASAAPARLLAALMAAVLVGGDAFHLVPRVRSVLTGREEALRTALGRGKQITSITMTVFYLLLWHIAEILVPMQHGLGFGVALYVFAAVRIVLCLLPQNRWAERYPPVRWGVLRNIPFTLMGVMIAARLFMIRGSIPGFYWAWLAVLLSFAFYLPVVLYANRNPKVGMLMLPKTCCYVWLLAICLSL